MACLVVTLLLRQPFGEGEGHVWPRSHQGRVDRPRAAAFQDRGPADPRGRHLQRASDLAAEVIAVFCLVAAVFASFSAVWAENRVSNLVSNFMSNLGVEWCVDFNVWLYFYM